MRLSSLPRRATHREYAEAAAELEDALASAPGCVAVYRTGGISAPGISDLDRILVADGPARDVWPELSPRTRELAMHTPFAADVATFERHRTLAHVEPLERARGEAVAVHERPEPELLELVIGAEGATVLLLQLAKTAVTGTAKVRPLLCLLHGLRHDLALARLSREDAPRAWQLGDDVAALRAAWFDRTDAPARFLELLADAPGAIGGALDAMAARASPFLAGERDGLTLRTPWQRARVRGGAHASFRAFTPPLLRTRRAGELAWRALGANVVLPPPLLALLAGDVAVPYRDVIHGRQELAAEHERTRPAGYGTLGLAPIFLA